MRFTRKISLLVAILLTGFATSARSDATNEQVKEDVLAAPHGLKIKVRMEGPYTADVPLQVVCYFKYTAEGAKKMSGAPVELDKRLGGVIGAPAQRREFVGDRLETLLIIPPKGSIKAEGAAPGGARERERHFIAAHGVGRKNLASGGGPTRRQPGRVRAAHPRPGKQQARHWASGNGSRGGMLLAYDTEKRLEKEGLSKNFTLELWNVEAGPTYFDETVKGVAKAITEAQAEIAKRSDSPYATTN